MVGSSTKLSIAIMVELVYCEAKNQNFDLSGALLVRFFEDTKKQRIDRVAMQHFLRQRRDKRKHCHDTQRVQTSELDENTIECRNVLHTRTSKLSSCST